MYCIIDWVIHVLSCYYYSFLGKVGKVLASEEEKEHHQVSHLDDNVHQQSITAPSCDSSVSSTVNPPVSIPQPVQHKQKKELLYS